MNGMAWESPRGPVSIDPETRDIMQNTYIRRVEKVDGKLYNVEFETFNAIKDPGLTFRILARLSVRSSCMSWRFGAARLAAIPVSESLTSRGVQSLL
jgi:hypothetical protein